MTKFFLLFFLGVVTAFIVAGGFLLARTYMVSADPTYSPKDITITRLSPTSAEIVFSTESPVIASIECSETKEGQFTLCGSDLTEDTNHRIKTSIILNPDKMYYFFIKSRNTTYDNLGIPFSIPLYEAPSRPTNRSTNGFPTDSIGVCTGNTLYSEEFDINKDGCIRTNDKLPFEQQ